MVGKITQDKHVTRNALSVLVNRFGYFGKRSVCGIEAVLALWLRQKVQIQLSMFYHKLSAVTGYLKAVCAGIFAGRGYKDRRRAVFVFGIYRRIVLYRDIVVLPGMAECAYP